MPDTDIKIQLAVLVTEMGHIKNELIEAKLARKDQYEKMEEQTVTLSKLDGRMEKVENSLADQSPTIQEFVTIKHKVEGAGTAGRWVWAALTGLLGLVATIAAAKAGWLSIFTGK
ncbi:hypothetical protein [Caballeronia sp. LZ034LL]|uniref:hypothetical protein n=1 Tax=Caballeronia sp. LZ034LL TaxID=3038567 RepID=UPI0028550A97|nr:hypothetical protein [Caballeronia sp. LZ034LL]MDR5839326.1 hypothetical protein [Caballeronia sp. LZ034LL]